MEQDNEIRSLALAGGFEAGLILHQTLSSPTPEDLRWAAVCLLNLGRYPEARDMLHRAVGRGCGAARVELGGCFRLMGQLGLAQGTLRALTQPLPAFDQALLEREWGAVHLALGDLTRAREAFERAWGLSFSPGAELLQAGIALALGFVLYQLGQDRAALDALERATVGASPARQLRIRQVRSLSLLYLGRYDEAQAQLEGVAEGLEAAPLASQRAVYHHACGLLERARGSLGLAYPHFLQSSEQAQALGEDETLCYAELEAATVQTVLGHEGLARTHLARARRVAASRRLEALLWWREGGFAARFGPPQGLEALELLKKALRAFESLELSREQAWVGLHMVDLLLGQGQPSEADKALSQVTDVRHTVGTGGFLALELRGLPRVVAHLESLTSAQYSHILLEDWRAVTPNHPRHVRLQTLGASRMWLDGQPLKFDLSRCLELACYFLQHPRFTLGDILLALFPDEDPRRARNYFHQVRYELERVVPGFRVSFEAGHYQLGLEHLRVSWDYQAVLEDLQAPDNVRHEQAITAYGGPLLPTSEGRWVQEQREELAWRVARAGQHRVQAWFEAGRYADCLEETSRLLEFDPYDESLHELLARATSKLEGNQVARHTLARLCQHLERDLGVVPARLARLRDQMVELN